MQRWIAWPLLFMWAMMALLPGALAETGYTIAGYDDQNTGRVWKDNLFFERMEELTGIVLETQQYTTAQSWQTAKDAMLAGELELPDALFKASLTTQETQIWYEAGKLIDLRPYLEEHAPNLWALLQNHPEWLEAITLPDGAIVALPYIDELQFTNAMWINESWLKRWNLPMPTTAEELAETLRFFRDHDMNGNGKKGDEIPLTFSSLWDLRYLLHAFGVNANDAYLTLDENGTVKEILTSDQTRAFLIWLNQLWNEGLLDANGFSGLRSLMSAPTEDSEVTYGVMFASSPADLVHVNKVEQYVLLEPLVYEGQQVYRDFTGDVVRGAFAITSACKNPAELLRWVDTFYTEEGYILSTTGMAGEEFAWNDDGTWMWLQSGQVLINQVLPRATIQGSGDAPGWVSVDFLMKTDETATQRILDALARLREIDSEPMPMVWLTQEQQERSNELVLQIGSYAEQQMVWFIAGDVPLNDETWAAFCQTVEALGVNELVSIWQAAVDVRR